MEKYDDRFFDYVDSGALRSADAFVRLLMPELQVKSMLDVGCGRGGWAGRWKAGGCGEVLGVDGDYVDRSKLYIAADEFGTVDLNNPFDLGRRFDLVQSLEVAEHLRPAISEDFIASIVRHGEIVLFSAATPGQGGTGHVNERSLEYWRDLFSRHSYAAFDFVREHTHRDKAIEPWYRYNAVLYASEAGKARLSDAVRRTEIPIGRKLPELSSSFWLLRRAVLKHFPVSTVDKMAAVNARLRALTGAPHN